MSPIALGDEYATVDELKSRLSIDGSNAIYDEELLEALRTSSQEIERFCNRQFNKVEAGAPTLRLFKSPKSSAYATVDDFHTVTGLVIETDDNGDGNFTTWTTDDYELEPFSGTVHGQMGWPYWRINALGSKYFPCSAAWAAGRRRARLRVTAEWGWSAVPAPVKQACLLLAAKNFQLKDAPLGVAGMSDFGVVRVQDDRLAQSKLRPYVRDRILIGGH